MVLSCQEKKLSTKYQPETVWLALDIALEKLKEHCEKPGTRNSSKNEQFEQKFYTRKLHT